MLIEAAMTLGKQLILIGNIRDAAYYDMCMQLADDKIRYLGYLDHHDPLLRSAYSACETFALPSTLETPGLAALEAAASGCNVVITEVGATREYFGENAIYINPYDSNSIIDGIGKSATLSPAPSKILPKFSWTNTASQLIDAYKLAMQYNSRA
jgi:glycosyltransferase involved in cell wall biosynthesis